MVVQRIGVYLLALSFSILSTLSFPIWMTDFTCDKKLEINEMIMGSKISETVERQIRLWRGDVEIFSGDSYTPLEHLRVRMSITGKAHLFEAKGGAKFVNGTCFGTRMASAHELLLFLPDHDENVNDVTIVAERIVKNKLDYLSSNAETSVASISEIMNRLTNQNEVEDDLHATDPATSPAHITASPTANKANKAKHHRRSRSVDTNVDLEPALPSDGAHVDFGGSKRSMLSKSDRAREMKKIRDRELFGVYGQGRGVHIEGKHHDEADQSSSSFFEKVGDAFSNLCSRMRRDRPVLFLCGEILTCIFLLYTFSRLFVNRYRISRYFGKKRGLL